MILEIITPRFYSTPKNSIYNYFLNLEEHSCYKTIIYKINITKKSKDNNTKIKNIFDEIEIIIRNNKIKLIVLPVFLHIIVLFNYKILKEKFYELKKKFNINILLFNGDWLSVQKEINYFNLPVIEVADREYIETKLKIDKENINCIQHFATKTVDVIPTKVKNMIAIPGRINNTYSNRIKFNKICKEYIYELQKFNVKIYNETFDDYINKIGNFISCFTSHVNHRGINFANILLAKYFEIPASGSLLFVDDILKDQLNKHGFIDGINCIIANESEYLEKTEWILNPKNREKVDEIRKNGLELIKNNHTLEHRLPVLNSIIKKYYNKE